MIQLYQFTACPFCYMVTRAIKKMGLKEGQDYELIDAGYGSKGREDVIRIGGQSQVPFMVDGNVKMYESSEIIEYIQKNHANKCIFE